MRRRWFPIAFAVLLACNLLPLTAEYLPFSDLIGHTGVAAGLARWNDPASRIRELYVPNPHPLRHSMLFEYLGALAGRVMPMALYTNLFVAVFWVAALPLSLLALLRAYGREPRLVLLILPFTYLVAVWMGFVNYLAAMPLVLLSLALLRRLLDEPTLARSALLVLSVTALVMAHFFGALVFAGLSLLVLLMELPSPKALLLIVPAYLPGWWMLRSWKAGAPFATKAKVLEMIKGPHDDRALTKHFYNWTLGGLLDGRSDYVLLALLVSVMVALVWSIAYRRTDETRRKLRVRLQPIVLLVVTAVMLYRLPLSVTGWWAVNVRLIPLVGAFVVLALPEMRRAISPVALLPAMIAGGAWGLYLTWDFHHHFNGEEMAGFDEVVDAVPPGRTLLALWPPRETDTHYMQFPFPYMGMLYVARHGGMATPLINGPNCDEPLWPRALPASPIWGQAHMFDWQQHAKGWQYFLIKQPPPGFPRNQPFVRAPPSAVRLVAMKGRWEVYQNLLEK